MHLGQRRCSVFRALARPLDLSDSDHGHPTLQPLAHGRAAFPMSVGGN
jgi:hypothetical protein